MVSFHFFPYMTLCRKKLLVNIPCIFSYFQKKGGYTSNIDSKVSLIPLVQKDYMNKTEAIKNFLTDHTLKDLAELYTFDMEVQVNVAQENGERIEGEFKGKKWLGWSDGINSWKPFRIPYAANTKPEYTDSVMSYDLSKYAEGIGMTGWDWKNKVSRWVAYDFDAIVGHSEKHAKKLTDTELQEVRDKLNDIDWTTIRYSTSGSGLHIYVHLYPYIQTNTHTEHAALARAILGVMSAKTGFNLEAKVDACGQNMWVWHRKMKGTHGLQVIKTGSPLSQVPPNWKDHLSVINGHKKRIVPKFVDEDDAEKLFNELTGQRSRVELDEEHRKLIKFIESTEYTSWYDADNNMFVTHTFALKAAHKELDLKGVFETLSQGQEGEQNCFCYPIRNGGWVVRRYTRGVAEHRTWDQDRNGWTRCYFNSEPNLKTLAMYYGGVEHPQGGYVFNEAEMAQKVASQLGSNLSIPNFALTRPARLKDGKDGKISIEIEQQQHDHSEQMKDWILERGKWKRVLLVRDNQTNEIDIGNYDDIIRHLVDENGNDLGWVVKTDGFWRSEPISHVSMFLEAFGLDRNQVKRVLGASVIRCWRIVNKPFDVEYPGERQWNRHAPQFRYPPSTDLDNLHYPTWLKILNHCGSSLDEYILQNDWCKINGILTGADYLKCWIASVFQKPTEPLPYLFFYSREQNTGKSIFHEALSLLVTSGVVRADQALGDTQFNGELENAVVCVIEETDLSGAKNKTTYNKIKDWVTSRQLPIRKLYETARLITNTTHWIHCTNDENSVPMFPGDTRIIMIHVPALEEVIAKRDLIRSLTKEAPDFLASIVNLELPECNDRLNLPVIVTSDKIDSEQGNKTPLDLFIEEKCFNYIGNTILLSEFHEQFSVWCDPVSLKYWSKHRIGKEINKNKYPKGRLPKNPNIHIANLSFTPKGQDDPVLPELRLMPDGFLREVVKK